MAIVVKTRRTKEELLQEIDELKELARKYEKYEKLDRSIILDIHILIKSADELKMMLDALVNAGFTREEAFTLMTTTINKMNV